MLAPTFIVSDDRPLTTARLRLRPYAADDLAALHAMFSREDVCRYLPWAPMDHEQARAKLEQRLRQAGLGGDSNAMVVLAEEAATGQTVGEFMLRLASQALQGEIGWSVHPDFQGRGFATEGAREMLRVGFDELGLHRIIAECDPLNGASVRVMEKLGMRREAHLRESEHLKGAWVDVLVYAMLESEWRAAAG
jgi:RimJ/RimL family protein N-acetyltransferase